MPAETAPHASTYLAWPPTQSAWSTDIPGLRQDIARLARAIAEAEQVRLLVSPGDERHARKACGSAVEIVPVPVDDLWVRDTGPVFVTGPDGIAGVDFGFNGWGDKQASPRDAQVAQQLLTHEGIARIEAGITAEGGSLEVDGEGTLMVTESSVVNPNRNPGRTRTDIEQALQRVLGVTEVIWLEGVRGEDITDCHVDGLARFAAPGLVALSRPSTDSGPDVWTRAYEQACTVLEQSRDARGRRLEVVEIPEPDPTAIGHRGPQFEASYINYYVTNSSVILPRFGDRAADDQAAATLRDLYPRHEIRQLSINAIAEGGGGIHCVTQQRPHTNGPDANPTAGSR
ncbi:agmatine deiminase family protein [Streptomyces noursei]|uniref:agmatine deiminase family protein n=1 Tax=Streptomyces TaxID=1883 RepID=UPI0035DDB49A